MVVPILSSLYCKMKTICASCTYEFCFNNYYAQSKLKQIDTLTESNNRINKFSQLINVTNSSSPLFFQTIQLWPICVYFWSSVPFRIRAPLEGQNLKKCCGRFYLHTNPCILISILSHTFFYFVFPHDWRTLFFADMYSISKLAFNLSSISN